MPITRAASLRWKQSGLQAADISGTDPRRFSVVARLTASCYGGEACLRVVKSLSGGRTYACSMAATSRSVVSMSEIDSSGNGDNAGTSTVLRYPPQLEQTSTRRSLRSSFGAAVTNPSPRSSH